MLGYPAFLREPAPSLSSVPGADQDRRGDRVDGNAGDVAEVEARFFEEPPEDAVLVGAKRAAALKDEGRVPGAGRFKASP